MELNRDRKKTIVIWSAIIFLTVIFGIGFCIFQNSDITVPPQSTKDGLLKPGIETVQISGSTQQFPLSELAETSTLLVYGEVTAIHESAMIKWVGGGGCYITDVEVTPSQVLRGSTSETVTVRTLGGTIGNVYENYLEVPELITGQKYLLFLYQPGMGGGMNTRGDYYYLRGLSQGVFLPIEGGNNKGTNLNDTLFRNYDRITNANSPSRSSEILVSDLQQLESDSLLPVETLLSLQQLQILFPDFNQQHPVNPNYFREKVLENFRGNVENDTMTQEECDRFSAQLDEFAEFVNPVEQAMATPDPEKERQKEALRETLRQEEQKSRAD